MFGISDPGIWLAYLLALVCLFYSIWFGININKKRLTAKRQAFIFLS